MPVAFTTDLTDVSSSVSERRRSAWPKLHRSSTLLQPTSLGPPRTEVRSQTFGKGAVLPPVPAALPRDSTSEGWEGRSIRPVRASRTLIAWRATHASVPRDGLVVRASGEWRLVVAVCSVRRDRLGAREPLR
jgi:hypothetical protein